MADPKKDQQKESREEYEVDVDRMINEGLAGGTVNSLYNRGQIEESRNLPHENEPYPAETKKQKHK
ncbi:hypothetical protein GLW08_06370 [Pontibacillus yanchengensis]|uniref:Uncharacterized protein n=2 Tax=Pontibacillus yanchengensis TaxID=462910 RepID=A0ACC7VDV4_9BACI|nr:hypothetical protein [Pontibacillus yanchengensis]MYL32382.1 hypothetical protein [Pontibacillus yanchengensis]MYL52962.1 hypothetical protein [Pontibacillus yanchengensis]